VSGEGTTVESLISDAMSAAIGGEIARRVSYPVDASDIRRWAVATYYPEEPPRRFWDAEATAGPIVAPTDFNPFAWMAVEPAGRPAPGHDPDAIEKALGIVGPGLKFGLNGGVVAEYGAPIAVGDTITAVGRLASYAEREGKLGQMLFTVTEDTWTNQRDEFVERRTMTLIRYGR
jgi:hypothetical protein